MVYKNGFLIDVKDVHVVFVDENSLWWLKFLKKGFRHCYILLKLDGGMTWLEVNPMSNQVFLQVHQFFEEVDYISYLKSTSSIEVLEVSVNYVGMKVAPFAWFSCVEMVKRVLGIHTRLIITPYQLYKRLKVVGKKS